MKKLDLAWVLMFLSMSAANAQQVAPSRTPPAAGELDTVFLYGRAQAFHDLVQAQHCDQIDKQAVDAVNRRFDNARVQLVARFGEKAAPASSAVPPQIAGLPCNSMTIESYGNHVRELEQRLSSSYAQAASVTPTALIHANSSNQLGGSQNGIVPFSQRPLLPAEVVTRQCLIRATLPLGTTPPPTVDTLAPEQWPRFVNCAIAANIRFSPGSISGNPDAIVRVDLDSDGVVESIALEQPSGDANWNKAIQQSIDIMPKLPSAPAGRRYHSLAIHFHLGPAVQGITGTNIAPTLHGTGHWSVHDCVSVGGTQSCI